MNIENRKFERHYDGDEQNNAILAPWMDCHDTGRIISGEPNLQSVFFDNAEQFSIDVSFNFSKAERR